MKKALMFGLMLLISVAFVTSVFAQSVTDKATKAATDAATDKAKAEGDAMKDKAIKAATDKAAAPAPAPVAAPAPAPAKAAAPAPEKKMAKAKTLQYTGEVTKMDMTAKSIVVKGKKGDMTFDVGMAKMKGDPKEGDKVVVKCTEKDGKMMATSVTKVAAKKPAAKPMAPEKPATPAPAK